MDPEEACPPSALFPSGGTEQQSPLKKPRVEESECEDDWEDEFYEFNGRPLTPEEFEKYTQQVEESNGFHVDPLPSDVDKTCLIVPNEHFKRSALTYNSSRLYSILAIEQYNKDNNTAYEFDDVEKLNTKGTCHVTCWVTFKATNMDDPGPEVKSKTFQARVVDEIHQAVVETCNLKEES